MGCSFRYGWWRKYVKKISSMKVTDIAKAIDQSIEQRLIGIRPGEKLHEQMIGIEDAPFTYEYKNFLRFCHQYMNGQKDPNRIGNGKLVDRNFSYNSKDNSDVMAIDELKNWINKKYGLTC